MQELAPCQSTILEQQQIEVLLLTTEQLQQHCNRLTSFTSRDVLQHLPFHQDAVSFLCHVFSADAKVLITTHFPGNQKNRNIEPGLFYKNNLHSMPPFDIPKSAARDCPMTHPLLGDPDATCVLDLTEPWVADFVSKKCNETATGV
mmetsp:Transcript_5921/g.9858  ORF Transcript_5921/g.9858 Transcript_5921/m.9858 type:complete len:146 (+) Transcript_5921:770-1207(+)